MGPAMTTMHTNTTNVPAEVEDIRRRLALTDEAVRSGQVTPSEHGDAVGRLRAELNAYNATLGVEGCPEWCNNHHAGWPLRAEDDWDRGHGMQRQGDNWYFDIDEGQDDPELGRITFAPMEYRELSLEQARAFAVAVLEALDTVESAR